MLPEAGHPLAGTHNLQVQLRRLLVECVTLSRIEAPCVQLSPRVESPATVSRVGWSAAYN